MLEITPKHRQLATDHIRAHKLDINAILTRASACDPNGGWTCGYVRDPNGIWEIKTARAGRILVMPEQEDFARQLAWHLREHGHGGRFQVAWIDPTVEIDTATGMVVPDVPATCLVIWKDKDGDVNFTIELEGSMEELFKAGWHRWVQDAELAYAEWREFIGDVDVQPHQMIQRAKGQRSVDPDAQPPL